MKILFVTLEQSARENLKVLLKNNFFQDNINKFYTFGMDHENLSFKDVTNIKIKSLMGFVDIFKNLPYLYNLRNSLYQIEENFNFTHIFFVDSFDFSKFYLNKFNNRSTRYCQFIGPSVFIWKKNKAKFINRYFDHIFSIFEVERKFYKKEKYSYIGHPLLNNIVLDNRDKYPIKNIGIFLGSRYQEIINNIPIISQLLKNLEKLENFNFYFFVTKEFEDLIKNSFINEKYQFYSNNREYYGHLSKLDFAFACSGTVHLELCFSNIPHIIFYKANIINYFIFKLFVRSKYLSLVNIFNKKEIVKEFIQNDFTVTNLSNFFTNLKLNKDKLYNYRKNMFDGINSSNFENFSSSIITDYLEKFS